MNERQHATQRQNVTQRQSHLDAWRAWIDRPSIETQKAYAAAMAETCAYSRELTDFAQWLATLDHVVTEQDVRSRDWPFGGFVVCIPGADHMPHMA